VLCHTKRWMLPGSGIAFGRLNDKGGVVSSGRLGMFFAGCFCVGSEEVKVEAVRVKVEGGGRCLH